MTSAKLQEAPTLQDEVRAREVYGLHFDFFEFSDSEQNTLKIIFSSTVRKQCGSLSVFAKSHTPYRQFGIASV